MTRLTSTSEPTVEVDIGRPGRAPGRSRRRVAGAPRGGRSHDVPGRQGTRQDDEDQHGEDQHGEEGPGGGRGGRGGRRGPGGRGGGRRGGRGGRGDVRAAILLLLSDEPMHGYQLIRTIADRSGEVWTPSSGSVYPALSQLEDEGLVTFDRVEGRKTATLTETGRSYVESHRPGLGLPWDDVSGEVSGQVRGLHDEMRSLMGAARQVSQVASGAQLTGAVEVLVKARRALYRILADDDAASS